MGVEGGKWRGRGAQQTMREGNERQMARPAWGLGVPDCGHQRKTNNSKRLMICHDNYIIIAVRPSDDDAWPPSVPALPAALGRLLPAGR